MDAINKHCNLKVRSCSQHMCCENRRGVLLLVVLSMLTLFLLLGAAYIAVARRARMTSRAFANNITATAAAGVQERKLLDDAFLTIVRGTEASSAPSALRTGDDLLGDKYGQNSNIQGRVVDVARVSGTEAILRLTTSGLHPVAGQTPPASAADLNGRVLTFVMPGLNVSTRILLATGSVTSATITVAAGPTVAGPGLSETAISDGITAAGSSVNIIINGREFSGDPSPGSNDTNEPYDGFDRKNPLLARVFSTEDYDGDGALSSSEDDNNNGLFDRSEETAPVNGTLDPGEDKNGNGVLDTVEEDVDNNGDGDGVFDIDEDLNNNGELDVGTVAILAPLYSASEDTNGNNQLDPGEDANGNNILDRRIPVDSDADGVVDSKFIDIGLPSIVDSQGKPIYPRAAITVVDLDSRLNLNTHGSQVDVDSIVGGNTAYPLIGAPQFPEIPMENIPRGSGVGPADISLMRSFSHANDAAFGGDVSASESHQNLADRPYVSFGGFVEEDRGRGNGNTTTGGATREVPRTTSTVGRYDDGVWGGNTTYDQRPGVVGINDAISLANDNWWGILNTNSAEKKALRYFTNPGRWGSPPDLKGRLRLWADPQSGQPVYYKPYWDDTTNNATLADNEVLDDPYEVQLSNRLASGNDKLFSPAELEGLLRYYDSDSLKLPRRLVQLTELQAGQNRNLFTTESWDTSAIVGPAWQEVIGSNFQTLLRNSSLPAPQRAVDIFSPEIVAGQKMDINRPFHDVSFDEPNDTTGTQRRQLLAKQLYCLMCAVAQENDPSITFTPEYAEMIAQYAVNIVDFRDADSVMTRFNYDPTFFNTSSWNPPTSAVVWGCERPELLITETLAWHDRRTDDLEVGEGSEHTTTGPFSVGQTADNDFDQQRRPRGAFFVELTSPWQSKAQQYAGSGAVEDVTENGEACRADPIDTSLVQTGTQDTDGDNQIDAGEDINFDGEVDDPAPGRFSLEARVDLSRAVGSSATLSPVWRLVSVVCGEQVDGGTALGQDLLVDVATNSSDAVLDPSRPGSSAIIDRAFYFTVPGSNVQGALPDRNFWQDAAHAGGPNPKLHQYVVAGTDAPFDFNEYDLAHPQTRVFVGPNGQPGTLTEPFTQGSDPYEELMNYIVASDDQSNPPQQTYTPPDDTNDYVGSWATGHDVPFDSITRNEDVNNNDVLDPDEDKNSNGVLDSLPSTVVSGLEIVGGGNEPLLMHNGTHENFSIIHLQRLANPGAVWNATTNPYITIDCMPVDLVVVNTNGPGSNNNVDEPGTTGGGVTLDYLGDPSNPREYYDTISGNEVGRTVERGGKITASAGPDTNQWSRRVNASITDLEDASAFLSTAPSGTPRLPSSVPYSVSLTNTLPGTFIHTLGTEDLNNNGRRDHEDQNNNGSLDADEDLDGDGVLDVLTEDADGDGDVDVVKKTTDGNGNVSWEDTDGDNDYAEEDLDGNGVLSIDGDNNGDSYFLTAAPQRFVDSTTYEPEKKSWLVWANCPFTSANEVALVPWCSPFHLTRAHAADHSADQNPVTQKFRHLLGFFENQNDLPAYSNAPSSPPTNFPWRAITGRNSGGEYSILDFLRVQSPFVGLEKSITGATNTNALTSIGRNIYPIRQISNYRDPGKINVNTITDARVWRSLFGDIRALGDPAPFVANYPAATPLPLWTPDLFGGSGSPAPTVGRLFSVHLPPPNANKVTSIIVEDANENGQLDPGEDFNNNDSLDIPFIVEEDANGNGQLDQGEDLNNNNFLDMPLRGRDSHRLTQSAAEQDVNADGTLDPSEDTNGNDLLDPSDDYRNTDIHSAFRYQTINRLQNLVTVRSNVYAISVTVGYFDSNGNEVTPRNRNRAFYIFDRSIPVAYEQGKDHNVRDAILLRRIIQ